MTFARKVKRARPRQIRDAARDAASEASFEGVKLDRNSSIVTPIFALSRLACAS